MRVYIPITCKYIMQNKKNLLPMWEQVFIFKRALLAYDYIAPIDFRYSTLIATHSIGVLPMLG